MRKLYEKDELAFALVWIGMYLMLMSLADQFSKFLGIPKLLTAPACVGLTALLVLWIGRNGLKKVFGLCRFSGHPREYLWFLPLVLLASTNLWRGLRLNQGVTESILYGVSMLFVGFLEEILFRGFLFTALRKENTRRAMVISSVSFGLGHFLNLLNGSPALDTLLQICYAMAVGFLFTVVFYKSGSLWPCIFTHSAINTLSTFANGEGQTLLYKLSVSGFLCALSLGYGAYLLRLNTKTSPKRAGSNSTPQRL